MKELFVWNSEYELGIPAIDNQHKKWLGIMNKLYNAFVKNESKQVILEIIEEIQEYTDYHFSTEENYFMQFSDKEFIAHLQLHQDFIKELKSLKARFTKEPDALTYKVMKFMQSWLTNHILKSDKQYIDLLKNKL